MIDRDLESTMAEILRQEIDREIVSELRTAQLVGMGWSLVTISSLDMADIGPWMQENMRGEWRGFSDRWLFESMDDAILFKMRWA